MTRADAIREMDDVQLANYLCSIGGDKNGTNICEECRFWNRYSHKEIYGICEIMKYLHKEATGDAENWR